MEIILSAQGSSLDHPDDFTAFKVLTAGLDPDAKATRLAEIGEPASNLEHVHVELDRLTELAGPLATDPTWVQGLGAMIAFADRSGWIDDNGRVRAHVEEAPQ